MKSDPRIRTAAEQTRVKGEQLQKETGHFYDPFPKYLQIRAIILRWLAGYEVGDKLPTEGDLAEQFNVSRETIREALRALEQDGTIGRKPRVGTWLAKAVGMPLDNRVTGIIDDFSAMGIATSARLVGQGVVKARPEVVQALKLESEDEVFEIRRLRVFNGSPLVLLEASFPVEIGRKVARLRLRTSLFVPALRRVHDPLVHEEYQEIDAAVATKETADLLQMPAEVPMLLVKRLFVDKDHKPVVFFVSHFRSDRYYYTVNLPKARGAGKALTSRHGRRSRHGSHS
jgi:GntR family transcriptional regulator